MQTQDTDNPLHRYGNEEITETVPVDDLAKVKYVVGDVILGEFADLDDNGDIKRAGSNIIIPTTAMKSSWRLVRALKVGDEVKSVKEGDIVVITTSSGIQGVDMNRRKFIFISEKNHVFCGMEDADGIVLENPA